METNLLTEIIEKSARNNKHCYDFVNCEQAQKERVMGQLYNQVDKYYRDLINNGKAHIFAGYFDENGIEYIHCGIFDNETGEQIL